MAPSDDPGDRRDFLLRVTALTGASCLGDAAPLRAAIAAALCGGKPVLTERTLNRLVTEVQAETPPRRRAAAAAAADLKAFLSARFALAPVQAAELDSLASADRAELHRAVMEGLSGANRLYVRIQQLAREPPAAAATQTTSMRAGAGDAPGTEAPPASAGLEIAVTRTPSEAGGVDVEITCIKRRL